MREGRFSELYVHSEVKPKNMKPNLAGNGIRPSPHQLFFCTVNTSASDFLVSFSCLALDEIVCRLLTETVTLSFRQFLHRYMHLLPLI